MTKVDALALVVTGSRLIICSDFSITEADNLVNSIKKENFRCYKKLVFFSPTHKYTRPDCNPIKHRVKNLRYPLYPLIWAIYPHLVVKIHPTLI
jgi:hypothetical protein